MGPNDTEANIGGLVEGKEYQFRVKAINDEGESEPLETDHATLAKNPYGKRNTPSLLPNFLPHASIVRQYYFVKNIEIE